MKIVRLLLSLILIAAFCLGGYIGLDKLKAVKVEKMHATLSQRLLEVAEFTTVKVNYSDCVSIKKSAAAGLSKAYSIVKFSGVVRVGIEDATKIRISIDEGGKTVRVVLPHAQILDNTISTQEVFDEKNGLFVAVTTQEIFDEIDAARKEKVKELLEGGILKDADKRTQDLMRSFAKGLGVENVYINFS